MLPRFVSTDGTSGADARDMTGRRAGVESLYVSRGTGPVVRGHVHERIANRRWPAQGPRRPNTDIGHPRPVPRGARGTGRGHWRSAVRRCSGARPPTSCAQCGLLCGKRDRRRVLGRRVNVLLTGSLWVGGRTLEHCLCRSRADSHAWRRESRPPVVHMRMWMTLWMNPHLAVDNTVDDVVDNSVGPRDAAPSRTC